MIAHEWTRRRLLKTAATFAGAGILQPVLPLVGAGKTAEAAYPEEVLDIDQYTKGRVKVGTIIDKNNADLIKDIAPEGLYYELKQGWTRIKIGKTNPDESALIPVPWTEATLRNKGRAVLDKTGNVWDRSPGTYWIGGDPFPEPKKALELIWDHGFSIRRYDDITITVTDEVIDPSGSQAHLSDAVAYKIQTHGRIYVDPKPSIDDYADNLFRQVFTTLSPFDVNGLSSLSIVFYDATKYPGLDLYIPTLKRTHSVPTTQRFDTLGPYGVEFVSDFDLQGDPILTWGWTVADRKPMLLPSAVNLGARAPAGSTSTDSFVFAPEPAVRFPTTTWELRPDVIFLDGQCHIPGCPYGKKRLFFDLISRRAQSADMWDKAGKLWRFAMFSWGMSGIKTGGYDVPDLTGIEFCDLQSGFHEHFHFYNKIEGIPFAVNSGYTIDQIASDAALQRASRR